MQIDKEAKNNYRSETRRHQSLSELSDKADLIADESIDIEKDILQKFDIDKLYDAIYKLKPSEQELIHKLYLDKHRMAPAQYAEYLKIQEKSVQEKSRRIRRKLEKLLEN